jgi:hypothetical protein
MTKALATMKFRSMRDLCIHPSSRAPEAVSSSHEQSMWSALDFQSKLLVEGAKKITAEDVPTHE